MKKPLIGILGSAGSLLAAHAQTGTLPALAQIGDQLPANGNVIYGMLMQILKNPSSLYVIILLCIVAWIIDDTPIIPSRYAKHICVVLGGCFYWMYATPSSVPNGFPHPYAVYIGNGTLCGFVAVIVHRQAVARVINLFRGNAPESKLQPTDPAALPK